MSLNYPVKGNAQAPTEIPDEESFEIRILSRPSIALRAIGVIAGAASAAGWRAGRGRRQDLSRDGQPGLKRSGARERGGEIAVQEPARTTGLREFRKGGGEASRKGDGDGKNSRTSVRVRSQCCAAASAIFIGAEGTRSGEDSRGSARAQLSRSQTSRQFVDFPAVSFVRV